MASAAGISPATSTFAKWRAINCATRTFLKMASVVGLAPTTFGLKGRSLELLCIHGRYAAQRILQNGSEWPLPRAARLHSAFKMVPKVGIAPTSPRLQRSANLSQLLGEVAFLQFEMCILQLNGPSAW
jgi:hypothetical protein